MISTSVFRWIATGIALVGTMLTFTMLLARYNSAPDKEFPILLSEFFEVNVRRQAAIVDAPLDATIKAAAKQFQEVWWNFEGVSTVLAYDQATIAGLLAMNATSLGPEEQQGQGLAHLINQIPTLVGSGPIKVGFDIYRPDFQELVAKVANEYSYDDKSVDSKKQYAALSSTLGVFELFTNPNTDADTKATLPTTAATAYVGEGIRKADWLFIKLRIQTRVAVAASVASIVAFSIALTILFMDHGTYTIVFLHAAAFIGAIIFLSMIQLNYDTQADLLRMNFEPVPESDPGPAVYGAGFMLAAAVLGSFFSVLYVRSSSRVKSDDEQVVAMDQVKSEEATKVEL